MITLRNDVRRGGGLVADSTNWPCLALLAGTAFAASGCAKPPLSVVAETVDQISICRETAGADFQEAENIAANFCADRSLMPRLAGTATCGSRAVRYNYICTAKHY